MPSFLRSWAGVVSFLAGCCLLSLPTRVPAQSTFTEDFSGYSWEQTMALSPHFGAVDMVFLPSGNMLVAQLSGRLMLLNGEGKWAGNLHDMAAEVSQYGDGGMLSILIHPDFENQPWLYLLYNVEMFPETPDAAPFRYGRVERVQMNPEDGYRSLLLDTREILLGRTAREGPAFVGVNHCTGDMQWGEDGTLLVSFGGSHQSLSASPTGDSTVYGESGIWPASYDIGALRSQTLDNYNGKILRIDAETGLGLPSNPFFTGDANDHASRIWCRGLRQPWRFTVLPKTGDHNASAGRPGALWIGDVGENTYEEIHVSSRTGGDNFGWPFWEGTIPTPESDFQPFNYVATVVAYLGFDQTTPPAASLGHSREITSVPSDLVGGMTAASITGGVFYDWKSLDPHKGSSKHEMAAPYDERVDNLYLFADWAQQQLYMARLDEFERVVQVGAIAGGPMDPEVPWEGIVNLAYSPYTGEIWALTYWKIYRLRFDPAGAPPNPILKADTTFGALPLEVAFDGSATTDPSNSLKQFQWLVDGVEVAVTDDPYYQHVFTEDSNALVQMVAINAADRSATASLRLYPGNLPPVISILAPTRGTTYPEDGSIVSVPLRGTAVDPDSEVPPTVTWRLALGHNTHRHEIHQLMGLEGSFDLTASSDTNTWYIVEMFATDARGQTVMERMNIYPESWAPLSAWVLY